MAALGRFRDRGWTEDLDPYYAMAALGRLRDRGRLVTEDLDAHYAIRADVPEAPPSRFRPKIGKRLSLRAWKSYFSRQGQLDFVSVINKVQRGGVDPSIRGEVWEYLLGCYPPDSTPQARHALRMIRRNEYEKLKKTCTAMDSTVGSGQVLTAAQIDEEGSEINSDKEGGIRRRNGKTQWEENPSSSDANLMTNGWVDRNKNVKAWKLILHQIGLDVLRTDRMLEFYENPSNRSRLWDILAVYAWYDPEVSYCQGMSDLCSPMVVLFTDEADAFWCFQHFMARVRPNFLCTENEVGVQKQLNNLSLIMKVMDPKLHRHLEHIGGGNYIFAFRMVMVLFRREFSFADTLYLWEMMWASEYIPNYATKEWREINGYGYCGKFGRQNLKYGSSKLPAGNASLSVYCMAAILKFQRRRLLKETQGLDDVVKLLNEVTGKIDAKVACKKAIKVHKAYLIKGRKLT